MRRLKHWSRRHSPEDKRRLIRTIWRWRAFSVGAFAFGIILMWCYCIPFSEMQQRRADVQIVCSIIKKYNPSFEPTWIEPTAQYLVDNAGPFDPVWLAVVGAREGSYAIGAESTAGAESWFQNLPDHSLSKAERLKLEYQTAEAIEKLVFFYEHGFPLKDKEGKLLDEEEGKGTVYGMHGGYVGYRTPKGRAAAMEYMAMIYCEYAQARGLVWKAGKGPEPAEEDPAKGDDHNNKKPEGGHNDKAGD